MEITGQITGIDYSVMNGAKLKEILICDFDVNNSPSSFILRDNNYSFAVSKWVSPKRTRSYSYERVYNTLNHCKKITVIPIVKDEGRDGDRDFIQWDTVSLMSLLDVFVIFAYYEDAEKKTNYRNKITNQKFNNDFVTLKIKEIENYHSSALHWNVRELRRLCEILENVKKSYRKISEKFAVEMHGEKGIDNFGLEIEKSLTAFMEYSREKAKNAQHREINTIQPKEFLQTETKAEITITNFLGGEYFFTVDETKIENDSIYLIETKHSKNSILPSLGDIKDGLLKMVLYCNLKDVKISGKSVKSKAVLRLTSSKFREDELTLKQKKLINNLLEEARGNSFFVEIRVAK